MLIDSTRRKMCALDMERPFHTPSSLAVVEVVVGEPQDSAG